MTKKPKHKSDAFEAIHTAIKGMLRVGTIDKAVMHRFDKVSLTRGPELNASQALLQTERGGADKPD